MGQTSGGKLYSDATMILNLRDSFYFLLNSHLNEGQNSILHDEKKLKSFIKENHYIISKNLVLNNQQGIVRNENVVIYGTEYKPLSNNKILDDEMNYLCYVASKIENNIEKSIYLHNNICYLQYFIDCNKRTARNLLTYSLLSANKFLLFF